MQSIDGPIAHLQAPRLLLYPYRVADIDALHDLWTEPGVRRFLWDDIVISREQAAAVVMGSIEDSACGSSGAGR